MTGFLKKHFNHCLTDSERGEILRDFPPQVLKLDKDVVEQLKNRERDPHFGQKNVLFKLQEALSDVFHPFMYLWEDLINLHVEVSLTHRALVLLRSASNAINLERRKIAWGRINPSLRSLATELYEKREDQLKLCPSSLCYINNLYMHITLTISLC